MAISTHVFGTQQNSGISKLTFKFCDSAPNQTQYHNNQQNEGT